MRKHLSTIPFLALILAAAAMGPLRAEEPAFTRDFKLRTGYGLSTKDNLRPGTLSLGFNFAYGTSAGKVGLEVGYFYKTGDQYIEPVVGNAPEPLSPVNLDRSGDSRKNSLEGLALRLSFQKQIDADWSWQAGLMLGGTRFKHEYVGDVQGEAWVSSNPASWRDTYYGTPTSGGIKVSPYVGAAYRIGDHSSLEVNLLLLNYSALNYVHHPGTASSYALDTDPYTDPSVGRISPYNAFPLDTLAKTNRLAPHLEFGYIFHF
jgi:hypothetical protein